MSPGINGGGARNTGTLPKSNRRNDRNRERSAANQQNANRSAACHGHPQHFNNLCQLGWQTVRACEREVLGAAKNSNTRSASSRLRSSYLSAHQGLPDCASRSSARLNYSSEDCIPWIKMVPPVDSRTQSPPRLPQEAKPSNVENADADTRPRKMPDRNQVESRLDQIRDYIKVTATMMDSLGQSSDPRAQAQNEKLSRMVEDLRDSETKLSKLLEQYQNHGISDESAENGREDMDERGDAIRETELLRNIEEYQTKLVQLQEHQANLVDMQTRVRERLNEARQAQRMLLLQENQNVSGSTASEGYHASLPSNVERLETETAALRGKLAQLQSKKKRMDHLVAELQAIEQASDKSSSCNCEDSRNTTIKDKVAELAAMKAQLAHIKALMEDGARMRDSVSELEQDVDADSEECGAGNHTAEFGLTEDLSNITYESSSSCDKADKDDDEKPVFGNVPTIEEMNAITRELKEQRVHIDAEIQRLRQTSLPALVSLSSSSSPPTTRSSCEKKQSNKVSTGASMSAEIEQMKRLEDLLKKLPNRDVNRDAQAPDQNSRRSSGSRCSHSSTPANLWPSCAVAGSNEQSVVDGIPTSDNLLDIGSQTAAVESAGFNGNLCACSVPPPLPPMNQSQHASVEYYRHLLSGAQTTQLQVMGTTLNHCCQLLWAQQRELQSLRAAIAQLQLQMRSQNHQESSPRINNVENHSEEHCNLGRGTQNLGDNALDGTLPPSSSLPNLVSLPNSTAALSHTPIVTSNSQQQQQQQQLNNQVPPGNRANNYWDNFRSYSRQNLLSGNVKTVTDSPTAMANSACSANTTNTSGSSVNSSLMKDKRNREHGTDNLPLSLTGAETQYSLNLQLPSNLQQQDRENTAIRSSNIMANEVSQQVDNLWEEAFRLPSATNDDNPLNNLSLETREAIGSLIATNKKRPDYLVIILREIKAITEDHRLRPHLLRSLRALQGARTLNNPLNEAPDLTQSESCQSSDEDSDVGAMLGFSLENPSSATELVASSHVDTASSPASSQVPLIDQLETSGTFSLDCASALPSAANAKPGYNEDLAEADQSRPDSSGNSRQELPVSNIDKDEGQEEAAASSYLIVAEATTPDLEGLAAKTEDERAEDTELDKFLTRLHHH